MEEFLSSLSGLMVIIWLILMIAMVMSWIHSIKDLIKGQNDKFNWFFSILVTVLAGFIPLLYFFILPSLSKYEPLPLNQYVIVKDSPKIETSIFKNKCNPNDMKLIITTITALRVGVYNVKVRSNLLPAQTYEGKGKTWGDKITKVGSSSYDKSVSFKFKIPEEVKINKLNLTIFAGYVYAVGKGDRFTNYNVNEYEEIAIDLKNSVVIDSEEVGEMESPAHVKAEGNIKPSPPVRAVGDIKSPKLIKKVDPIFPKVAIQGRVEGTVTIEVTTDIYGRVQNMKILKSIPLLDKAAIDAVRQWVYEPVIIKGRPRGVIFVVNIPFKLK